MLLQPPHSEMGRDTMKRPRRRSERSSRRTFLKRVTSGSVAAALARPAILASAAWRQQQNPGGPGQQGGSVRPVPFVGVQAGAVSFVDEGVDTVLDNLQERAGVNTLLLAVFTYGRGIAGRQFAKFETRSFMSSAITSDWMTTEWHFDDAIKSAACPAAFSNAALRLLSFASQQPLHRGAALSLRFLSVFATPGRTSPASRFPLNSASANSLTFRRRA